MLKRLFTVSLCLLALILPGFAQMKKSPMMKKSTAGPGPDKAYLQKIGRLEHPGPCQCSEILRDRAPHLL